MTVYFQKLREADSDPASLKYWNMWQHRLRPYNELALEDRVVLIRPRLGRQHAEFVLDTRVQAVVHQPYASREDAIHQIADALEISADEVREHEYTQDKVHPSGYLLAWTGVASRELAVPVPPSVRLGQNGWLVVDDDEIAAEWGL